MSKKAYNHNSKILHSQATHLQINKRLTIDLSLDLHTKLKITSAKTGKPMNEIVKELLENCLIDENI